MSLKIKLRNCWKSSTESLKVNIFFIIYDKVQHSSTRLFYTMNCQVSVPLNLVTWKESLQGKREISSAAAQYRVSRYYGAGMAMCTFDKDRCHRTVQLLYLLLSRSPLTERCTYLSLCLERRLTQKLNIYCHFLSVAITFFNHRVLFVY